MIGYGYGWLVPMDYRIQSSEILDGLNEWLRFLMVRELLDTDKFLQGGRRNPRAGWAEKSGLDYSPPE